MQPLTAVTSHPYRAPDLNRLLRRPDSLAGQRFVLKGRVTQSWEDDGEPTLILEVDGGLAPDNEVAVTLPGWPGPLPQGELVVYGVCRGAHIEAHTFSCGAVARPHLEAERLE